MRFAPPCIALTLDDRHIRMTAAHARILLPLAGLLLAASGSDASPVYRDLNHNGRLDPYEDSRRSADVRIDDLLMRMTLEEKVGTMMHASLPSGDPLGAGGTGYDMVAVRRMILERHVTSAITRLSVPPAELAEQNNAVQRLAETTRLWRRHHDAREILVMQTLSATTSNAASTRRL
ncbi:hypothetical protein AWL63_16030 [Sphingomonas panacis]|uniref:Glycoside hydrolase family 3 N-terminal domain-containing protein n=1 Tax=Sphingomonas panacis TaxID=1560345 RepID=A0A1B3ZCU1_9SPHN|nr:hypothetical protein [Sphingomonas panacis]AOH85240.1 hypothetical protein AWL63_16030 [Sphingomonas panacis]